MPCRPVVIAAETSFPGKPTATAAITSREDDTQVKALAIWRHKRRQYLVSIAACSPKLQTQCRQAEGRCERLQVSVGRLGIITQLTLSIVPQQAVQRSLVQISDAQFAQQVKLTQDAYTAALASNNQTNVVAALAQLDETQVRTGSGKDFMKAVCCPLPDPFVGRVFPSCPQQCISLA